MSRQYNVKVEDEDMADIESAVPGTKGGTAIRVAASSDGDGGRGDES